MVCVLRSLAHSVEQTAHKHRQGKDVVIHAHCINCSHFNAYENTCYQEKLGKIFCHKISPVELCQLLHQHLVCLSQGPCKEVYISCYCRLHYIACMYTYYSTRHKTLKNAASINAITW
jgi:hypothetical protein